MKDPVQIIRFSAAIVSILTIALFAMWLRPPAGSPAILSSASRLRPQALLHGAQVRSMAAVSGAAAAKQPPSARGPAVTGAAPTVASMTDILEENRRLRADNELLQDRLRAVLNWILANFRGRFPLPEPLFSRVQIAPLTEDGLLNPEIGDLLRLSPDEVDRLNDALGYAVDYLGEIESAIMTVTEPRAGKIVLHIPTFKENGQLLKEDLYAALEATLGSERFNRFLKVAEKGLMQRFYHFGEASRTMVFELTYAENDPTPRILIKDGYILEIEPGVREITATETIATNIPPKYAAYLAWLPDYLGGAQRTD